MVVFTCYGCNEVLKKPQVDRHKSKCRRSHVISCVDCLKDFQGDEFQNHTKCISEDQKYGGEKYVVKENKGEAKQERWFETVQEAIDSVSNSNDSGVKNLLKKIRNYPNIPQKATKFKNFIANCIRERDEAVVSRAWIAIFSAAAEIKKKQEKSKKEEQNVKENGNEALNAVKIDEDEIDCLSELKKDSMNGIKKRKLAVDSMENSTLNDGKSQILQSKELQLMENVSEKKKKKTTEKLTDEKELSKNDCTDIVEQFEDISKPISLKSLIRRLLMEAENNELSLKRLKKMIAKEFSTKDDEGKQQLGICVEEYLKKRNTKYATDGKIVRFAVEN